MLLVTFSVLTGFCRILFVFSGSFSDKLLILLWIEINWPFLCAAPEKVPKNLTAPLYIAWLYLVCAIPQTVKQTVNLAFCPRDAVIADYGLNQGHVNMLSRLLVVQLHLFLPKSSALCSTYEQGHWFMHCVGIQKKSLVRFFYFKRCISYSKHFGRLLLHSFLPLFGGDKWAVKMGISFFTELG